MKKGRSMRTLILASAMSLACASYAAAQQAPAAPTKDDPPAAAEKKDAAQATTPEAGATAPTGQASATAAKADTAEKPAAGDKEKTQSDDKPAAPAAK
jgi:hypothetical protein